MKELVLTQRIEAPIEVVWDAVTDHRGMVNWSPLKKVVLERQGEPAPNGLGAVRRMIGVGPSIVEEVTEWEPPHRYVYLLRKGAPIRNHRGDIQLRTDGAYTQLQWTIRFAPTIPGTGWLIVALLRKVIGGTMLSQLKTLLEGTHPTKQPRSPETPTT